MRTPSVITSETTSTKGPSHTTCKDQEKKKQAQGRSCVFSHCRKSWWGHRRRARIGRARRHRPRFAHNLGEGLVTNSATHPFPEPVAVGAGGLVRAGAIPIRQVNIIGSKHAHRVKKSPWDGAIIYGTASLIPDGTQTST